MKRSFSQANLSQRGGPYGGNTRQKFKRVGFYKPRQNVFSIPRKMPTISPLGNSKLVTMKYYENISINPGAGVVGDHVFSANGAYDPNVTGVGTQPYGFDQLMLFYDHFTVISSKCTVEFYNPSTTLPTYIGIMLRDSVTSYTGMAQGTALMEPGFKRKLVGTAANVATGTVTMDFNAKQFFHKSGIVGESDYMGSTSGNPAEQAYFHVILAPQNNTDDIGSSPINITIEYNIVLSEPKMLSAS